MNLRWYPWHIGDYAHDTPHLTLAEDGAYRRLIDAYMVQREPLPDNDRALARLAGVGLDEWMAVATNVRAFFRARDGILFHKRCEQELRAQELYSQKQSEKGKKGAFARYSKFNKLNGTSIARAWPLPATLNKETITTSEQGAEKGLSVEEKREAKKVECEISPSLAANVRQKGWA
jgi:uncharacterized protein YdaU (DUF1376 family)